MKATAKEKQADVFELFDTWTFEELDTMRDEYERASNGEHVSCTYDRNYYAGAEHVLGMAYAYCLGTGWAKDKMTSEQLRHSENFDRFWVLIFESYSERKRKANLDLSDVMTQRTVQYYIGALEMLRLLRAYRGKGDDEE